MENKNTLALALVGFGIFGAGIKLGQKIGTADSQLDQTIELQRGYFDACITELKNAHKEKGKLEKKLADKKISELDTSNGQKNNSGIGLPPGVEVKTCNEELKDCKQEADEYFKDTLKCDLRNNGQRCNDLSRQIPKLEEVTNDPETPCGCLAVIQEIVDAERFACFRIPEERNTNEPETVYGKALKDSAELIPEDRQEECRVYPKPFMLERKLPTNGMYR